MVVAAVEAAFQGAFLSDEVLFIRMALRVHGDGHIHPGDRLCGSIILCDSTRNFFILNCTVVTPCRPRDCALEQQGYDVAESCM